MEKTARVRVIERNTSETVYAEWPATVQLMLIAQVIKTKRDDIFLI